MVTHCTCCVRQDGLLLILPEMCQARGDKAADHHLSKVFRFAKIEWSVCLLMIALKRLSHMQHWRGNRNFAVTDDCLELRDQSMTNRRRRDSSETDITVIFAVEIPE